MIRRVFLVLSGLALLTARGQRDEFRHETVEAYQADGILRADILQKCADHITIKMAFKTSPDTDECRKAFAADQDVRLAAHQAREAAASNAALSNAAKQFEGH